MTLYLIVLQQVLETLYLTVVEKMTLYLISVLVSNTAIL